MPIQYEWKITSFEVKQTDGQLSNVIVTANWELTGTQLPFSAKVYGLVRLQAPDPANFIPYNSISKETATTWVLSALGDQRIAGYKDAVDKQIANLQLPTYLQLSPPWAKP